MGTYWSKFLRTFASAEVAVVTVGLTALNEASHTIADLKVFTLGSINAVLAGISAVALARAGVVATSPLGKSIAQTFQVFGTGVVTIQVADWTNAAAVTVASQFGWLAIASAGAGLLSFLTLEKSPPVTQPE